MSLLERRVKRSSILPSLKPCPVTSTLFYQGRTWTPTLPYTHRMKNQQWHSYNPLSQHTVEMFPVLFSQSNGDEEALLHSYSETIWQQDIMVWCHGENRWSRRLHTSSKDVMMSEVEDIGRLRHFKSPDDWGGDDGHTMDDVLEWN